MAKIRSHVVSRASCAVVVARARARRAAARDATAARRRRARRGSRGNRNVLAAVLEAALAALYLEHGFEAIEPAIVAAFDSRIEFALHEPGRPQDRAPGGRSPARGRRSTTRCSTSEGPPHERTFTAAALIDGEEAGVGRGRLEEGRRAGRRRSRR